MFACLASFDDIYWPCEDPFKSWSDMSSNMEPSLDSLSFLCMIDIATCDRLIQSAIKHVAATVFQT